MRYFDASALVKRYVDEPHSELVRELLGQGDVTTARLTEAEVSSVVVRRWREGALSARQRDLILQMLRADLAVIDVVELVPAVMALVHDLLIRHPLRAGDALQLAASLYLQREIGTQLEFVGFDHQLNRAAEAEGLTVIDG